MQLRNVVIVGAGGGFGTRLSRKLAAEGVSVTGIDPAGEPAEEVLVRSIRADVGVPDGEVDLALGGADCVILALPEAVALEHAGTIADRMRPGSLLVDLLSVKTPIVHRLEAIQKDVERLSIHPMFGPSLDFEGRSVVVVEVSSGPRASGFVSMLERWGARVTYMTAEQHDVGTAAVQVATHAAILAFGATLSRLGYDVGTGMAIATPPHMALLALLARIVDADPEIYWKIQTSNPMAEVVRKSLAAGVQDLDAAAASGDFARFRSLLSSSREVLEPELQRLAELCAELFAATTE